jgi:hypothetical protein
MGLRKAIGNGEGVWPNFGKTWFVPAECRPSSSLLWQVLPIFPTNPIAEYRLVQATSLNLAVKSLTASTSASTSKEHNALHCILRPNPLRSGQACRLGSREGQSNGYKTCRHDHQETCSFVSAQSCKSQGTHSSVQRHRESTIID